MACRHQKKGRYSPQTAVSTCFRRVTENLAKGPRSDGIGPVVGWCWCFRSRGDMSGLRVFWLSPPLDGKGNSGNNRHHCDDKDRVKRPRRTWRHDLVREAVRGHACAFAERSVLCSFELHSTDRIAVATHPVRLRTRTVPLLFCRPSWPGLEDRTAGPDLRRPLRRSSRHRVHERRSPPRSAPQHHPRGRRRRPSKCPRARLEIDVRRNSDVQRGLHVHRRKSVICRSRHLSSGCCSDSVHR